MYPVCLAVFFGLAAAPIAQKPGDRNYAANTHAIESLGVAGAMLKQASEIIVTMKDDRNLTKAMKKARGIFIVPAYGRAAVLVGGPPSSGIVVSHEHGNWSDPVFFHMAAISTGRVTGSIVFLLMSTCAMHAFATDRKFSLNEKAGFKIARYSGDRANSTTGADVIVWSANRLGNETSVDVRDIYPDRALNVLYYGDIPLASILSGHRLDIRPAKNFLQQMPR